MVLSVIISLWFPDPIPEPYFYWQLYITVFFIFPFPFMYAIAGFIVIKGRTNNNVAYNGNQHQVPRQTKRNLYPK